LANQVTSSIGRTQEKTVESEAMIEGKVSNKIVQTSSSTAYRENCEKPYNQ
jgi:hypothetical protein